jgi:hypothetical protein
VICDVVMCAEGIYFVSNRTFPLTSHCRLSKSVFVHTVSRAKTKNYYGGRDENQWSRGFAFDGWMDG